MKIGAHGEEVQQPGAGGRCGGRAGRLGAGDLGVLAAGAAHHRCAGRFVPRRQGATYPGRGVGGPGCAGLPQHPRALLRPVLFLDLHVLVDGRQTLFEAHALTETIEGVIQQIVPHADVTVHPEPY